MGSRSEAKKHTHKYFQDKENHDLWTCARMDGGRCSHFIPKNMKNTVEGRLSICWTCGKELVMDDVTMMTPYPVHEECEGYFAAKREKIMESMNIEDYIEEQMKKARALNEAGKDPRHEAEEDQIEVTEPDEEPEE